VEDAGADAGLTNHKRRIDMDIEMMVGMAASIILNAIKGPQKKAKLKAVLLKVYKTIKMTYANDPDFQ
jgi:hypothetical protein